MTAQIGDVVDLAARPVVFEAWLLGSDQQLLRAQGVGDVLVFHRRTDAVADIDIALQLRTADQRVCLHVFDHVTFEQVDAADEFADQTAGRGFVDIDRAADLRDPAQVHDCDALGHGHGLFLIVSHHYTSHADALDDLYQFQLHLRTQFLVQRAHRLVEQQQLGLLASERARATR